MGFYQSFAISDVRETSSQGSHVPRGSNGVSDANGRSAMSSPLPHDRPSKRLCVLVVDDEPNIVDFLCMLLEEEGYDVLRAYDGQQAWELARREHPDLVISDVMMPKMSGVELLDRLRDTRDLECTPVILMSAVARPQRATDVAFLPKPFDIDHMLDLVVAELAAG